MIIKDRFDGDIELDRKEESLLLAVKKLFASKDDFGSGAYFRKAFVDEIMEDYCEACGRSEKEHYCYCKCDD